MVRDRPRRHRKTPPFRCAECWIPQSGTARVVANIGEGSSVPKVEMIKSLERGLHVLQALQASPIASLHDLFLATRISKPSLLRILNTLEHAGVVSRRLADGQYRISAFARMGRKRDHHDRVAEAAAPVLDRLCQKVRWPS